MKVLRSQALAAVCLSTLLVLPGCSDLMEPPPQLVGLWTATSLTAGGQDEIANGLQLSIRFNADNSYTITVNNDTIFYCEGETNCTDEGEYEATASQITFDPGTEFEATATYSISGDTMTFSGNFEGLSVQATLVR